MKNVLKNVPQVAVKVAGCTGMASLVGEGPLRLINP